MGSIDKTQIHAEKASGLMAPVLLTLFFAMLCFPEEVFQGASEGLLLWYRTVLPTILPFLIMSGILIKSNLVFMISRVLYPFLGPVFGVSEAAVFAVFGGFLCGYPVGAKLSFDLAETGAVSEEESAYLRSFCNQASPMFVISYICVQTLHRPDLALPSLLILWGSSILCSFFFRKCLIKKDTANPVKQYRKNEDRGFHMSVTLLDSAIGNGGDTILRIGGYLMVFSILTYLLRVLPLRSSFWTRVCLPFLEITGGIRMLASTGDAFAVRYVLIMALTASGGLCAAFQTRCTAGEQAFSMSRYLTEKLVTAVVTSLFAYGFMQLY